MKKQGRDPKGETAYPFVRLGYNYRLSDMYCALGIAQLERLQEIQAKRKRVAEQYTRLLKALPSLKAPLVPPGVKLSWFVYVVQLNEKYTNKDREVIIKKMAQDKGLITMRQDGILKVIEGITTLEEVLRVTQKDYADISV